MNHQRMEETIKVYKIGKKVLWNLSDKMWAIQVTVKLILKIKMITKYNHFLL